MHFFFLASRFCRTHKWNLQVPRQKNTYVGFSSEESQKDKKGNNPIAQSELGSCNVLSHCVFLKERFNLGLFFMATKERVSLVLVFLINGVLCIVVIVVVLDNIERGCDRFGKERATSWCQGWLLQEFSAAYRQGSDCHSWFSQVRFNLTNIHWFSYVLIFVLIILVPWEKLIIHLLEKITFSQFEWDIGGLNIPVKSIQSMNVICSRWPVQMFKLEYPSENEMVLLKIWNL